MPENATKPASAAPKPAPAALARLVRLSPELAAVIGPEPRTRAAVTVALWAYIREHGLQDPVERTTIMADDALRPIIGERIPQMKLQAALGRHLSAA